MKKVKTPKKKKSLLVKTSSRADSPKIDRKRYLSQFNSLVKDGMSAKSAAKKVQKQAVDDIAMLLDTNTSEESRQSIAIQLLQEPNEDGNSFQRELTNAGISKERSMRKLRVLPK